MSLSWPRTSWHLCTALLEFVVNPCTPHSVSVTLSCLSMSGDVGSHAQSHMFLNRAVRVPSLNPAGRMTLSEDVNLEEFVMAKDEPAFTQTSHNNLCLMSYHTLQAACRFQRTSTLRSLSWQRTS
jgi:hypothetical protein